METRTYSEFNQTVYETTLENGLRVRLIPMTGFHKTYAMLTTDFGAVDRSLPDGQPIPAGMAHFLEHKLFEKADHDAFDLFGALGADANAFTAFTQTSYLYSTTGHFKENLDVLLDFVQTPYFTDQTVQKEIGIISQEIRMYNDNPDSRLYMGMLGNLYPHDPLADDIAGTEESLQKITPELLYAAHVAYYQPEYLTLQLAGNLDPEETLQWIKANQAQKAFKAPTGKAITFEVADPTGKDILPYRHLTMPVSRPKVIVGLRGVQSTTDPQVRLKRQLAISLMLELLFDDTGRHYQDLYNRGIIDDSFSFNFESNRGFNFAMFATETEQQAAFRDAISQLVENASAELAAVKDQFMMLKNGILGRLVGALDSPETVVNRFATRDMGSLTIFDEIRTLKALTWEEVEAVAKDFMVPDRLTVYEIDAN
ncbi:EF-P 5-aminopentanol modification-associated protein YfmH [Lactobacillus sp. 3B(2020)]|uniref:EF-P 5-aminopentanol modification-associated protein YfmH n=1 Tax=Lactobacillus sp. 3B(2020) TaxID=2695882 RepID=UPI0015DE1ABF|nr:pitrilysin family protein [Lactobacillus sp. 3B(2020)]QLL69482.1 insulinase family protein [Lactobacillus sp. 3B(2020)]